MNDLELAYAAGIIDGEGTIGIVRASPKGRAKTPSVYVQVTLANLNEWLVRWVHSEFGGCICEGKRLGRPPIWRWTITHKRAIAFIAKIVPYLKIKKAQGLVAIEFQKTKGWSCNKNEDYIKHELRFWQDMRKLNTHTLATNN